MKGEKCEMDEDENYTACRWVSLCEEDSEWMTDDATYDLCACDMEGVVGREV